MKKRKNSLNYINFIIISFSLAFLGQYFLFIKKNLSLGLLFFLIGLIIFIIVDKNIKEDKDSLKELIDKKSKEKINKKIEILFIILIILIGIFFRTYMIDTIPTGCFRDEGQNGNEALNILNEIELDGTKLPVYIDRSTQNAAMYMYFIAVFFKLFGIGVLQIRFVSVFLGILTIPAFYFLVRYLFGPRMAIWGGFLLSVMRWHVNFSRIGFLGIFTVFLTVLVIYFMYRVWRERRIGDFLLLGFVSALSLYSYIAARLIPVGIFLFMIFILIFRYKFYVKNLKKVILSIIVFIVTFTPLGNYVIKHPDLFMRRTNTVSIFNKEILKAIGGVYVDNKGNAKPWYRLYLENAKKTLLMFNYYGDGNPRHNAYRQPMLDFFTGLFAFLGFGYLLYNIFSPYSFLLLSLFIAFLQAGLFSIEAPQAYRTIPVIPIVLLFAIIYISNILYFIEQKYKKLLLYFLSVLIAISLYIGYENYDFYFNKQAKNPGFWAEFSTSEWHMGKYVHSLGNDWIAIVNPAWVNSYTFRFMTYPYNNYVKFDISKWIPIRTNIYKNFVYILDPTYLVIKPILEKMYPNGRYWDFRHKYENRILYFAYEVPYEDVKKYLNKPIKNGLTGYYYKDTGDFEYLQNINNHWKGNPILRRLDPFILFNWTENPILAPFSVKWVGRIKIEKDGEYTFATRSNDYSDLFIDGKQLLKNPGTKTGGSLNTSIGKIYLKRGFHKIIVRYYESKNYSKMQLWWKVPGGKKMEVVPNEVLYPED